MEHAIQYIFPAIGFKVEISQQIGAVNPNERIQGTCLETGMDKLCARSYACRQPHSYYAPIMLIMLTSSQFSLYFLAEASFAL